MAESAQGHRDGVVPVRRMGSGRLGRRMLIATPLLGLLLQASRRATALAQQATPGSVGGESAYSRRAAVAWLIGDDLHDHALVLIAYGADYDLVPATVFQPFSLTQQRAGGWARDGSTSPRAADAQTTALIIQALAVTQSGGNPLVPRMQRRGLRFLRSLLTPGGGFAMSAAEPRVPDATSTALVLRALIASYEDPTSLEWGNAPLALARFWTPSGGFRSLLSDSEPDLQASLQAIPTMQEKPLPIKQICDS